MAAWEGFPVGVVGSLAAAETVALGPETEFGLILVPEGETEDGTLVLNGYSLQNFPERALAPRAMRHHCTAVSEARS